VISRVVAALGCALTLLVFVAEAVSAQSPVYADRLTLPAAGDSISSAAAVTVDPGSGEILVVDQRKQRIIVFDQNGMFRSEITGGDVFSSPGDLAIDREGYLFLLTAIRTKRGHVLHLDFDGKLVREIILEGLPEDAEAPELASIAVTPDGQQIVLLDGSNGALWIADRNGGIRHAVDLTEGLSDSERRDLRLGHVDIYGDRILAAVPSLGEIRCYDLEGASCGVASADRGGQCGMIVPMAAALDGDGNYVIVDQLRMVLLLWDPEANSCLGEFYSIGSAPGYFYFPHDVALDSRGRLYVAQAFEGRVQVYEGLTPPAESAVE
jgi:DNA-binding beta-propeller fold protein YncE